MLNVILNHSFNEHLLSTDCVPGAVDKAVTKINQFPVLVALKPVGETCAGKTVQEGGTARVKTLRWEDPGSCYFTQTLRHEHAKDLPNTQMPPVTLPLRVFSRLSSVPWIISKVLSSALGALGSCARSSAPPDLGDCHSRPRPQIRLTHRPGSLRLTIGQFGECRALVGWGDRQLGLRP